MLFGKNRDQTLNPPLDIEEKVLLVKLDKTFESDDSIFSILKRTQKTTIDDQ